MDRSLFCQTFGEKFGPDLFNTTQIFNILYPDEHVRLQDNADSDTNDDKMINSSLTIIISSVLMIYRNSSKTCLLSNVLSKISYFIYFPPHLESKKMFLFTTN